MTLIDHIRLAKESDGGRIAMISGDRRWNYDEFDDAVQHLAFALSGLGIQSGDRVALQLSNTPEYVAFPQCSFLSRIARHATSSGC